MALSQLLTLNYQRISFSPEICLEGIISFLDSDVPIESEDIYFLKKLTKVASHFITATDELDKYIEKIYGINIACARRLEEECNNGLEAFDKPLYLSKKRLQSHFLSHAGKIAKTILMKMSGDIEWAVKWYECEFNAAETAKEADTKHSAYSYGFAADAAKKVFSLTKDINWAVKWYECDLKSAQMIRDIDRLHSACSYAIAGNAAKEVFQLNNDIAWAVRWYNARIGAGEQYKKPNPLISAYMFFYAGDAARELYFITGEKKWHQKAVTCYTKSLGLLKRKSDSDFREKIVSRLHKLQDFD